MDDAASLAISLIDWGEYLTPAQRPALLVKALGMAEEDARLLAAKSAPLAIDVIEAPRAAEAVRTLASYEVAACAPSIDELAAGGPTLAARSLGSLRGGQPRFTAEIWRREFPEPIDTRSLFQLLRVKLSSRSTRVVDTPASNESRAAAYAAGGAYSAAIDRSVRAETNISTSDILDLHLTDGTIVRINGDKFNYDVLGDNKGYSDAANTDALAVMIAEESPMATLTLDVRKFHLPKRVFGWWRRHGLRTPLIGGVPDGLDLFSRWRRCLEAARMGIGLAPELRGGV